MRDNRPEDKGPETLEDCDIYVGREGDIHKVPSWLTFSGHLRGGETKLTVWICVLNAVGVTGFTAVFAWVTVDFGANLRPLILSGYAVVLVVLNILTVLVYAKAVRVVRALLIFLGFAVALVGSIFLLELLKS